VLQVSSADRAGGAEQVAFSLCRSYRSRGHDAWLAVGRQRTAAPHVIEIPNDNRRTAWQRLAVRTGNRLTPLVGRVKGAGALRNVIALQIGQPRRWFERRRGLEDFSYPASWDVCELPPRPPDILHCHNLHGEYFDLRALPTLSRRVPTVVTLHDAWMLSGHCAHSLGCERWMTGCGACPDLTIPPGIPRDATADNWHRKQQIYSSSRLYVATPSRWLMDRVDASMLAPAIVERRVIPNGVDLTTFRPAGRSSARAALGLPPDATVILFAANGIRKNVWKDFETLRASIAALGRQREVSNVMFVAIGEDAPAENIGGVTLRFVPFQEDASLVARYYHAADVYVHAAKADTFPTTVLEALACGLPVVATDVGGISEQVRTPSGGATTDATGILVGPGDAAALAGALMELLRNDGLRARLGRNAACDAKARFDLNRQVDTYLDWYRSIAGVGNRNATED
jgi:glycosyltransferase involved in cell wall biosynthesis